MSVVVVKNLNKSFGSIAVLNGVSLSAEAGDILFIHGENGQGKTTLLRCLAGLIEPDNGVCKLSRACFSFPHEDGFFTELNVLENLKAFGELQGYTAAEFQKHTSSLFQILYCHEIIKKYYKNCSRGERQYVHLIKTFLDIKSEIFIIDEPFAHLDEAKKQRLEQYIFQLATLNKKTFILTGHFAWVHKNVISLRLTAGRIAC